MIQNSSLVERVCQALIITMIGLMGFGMMIESVVGAPPINDNFNDAIPLRGLILTTVGNNTEATKELGEPNHAGFTGGHSLWWTWQAPSSGAVTITTSNSTFDTTLGVYLGTAVNALSLIVSNDDNSMGGTWSRVEFVAAAGTTYHIAVDGFSSIAFGAVTLNIAGTLAGSAVSLVPTGSVWRYLDNGTDQGVAWREPAFNDSGWAGGPAELGFGDATEGRPETTLISRTNSQGGTITTFYFRHAFVVPNASQFSSLTLRLMRDDGAAVYLNGNEIVRDGLNAGAAYSDFATITVAGVDEYTYYTTTGISATNLANGTNVLGVEVHQVNATSSDISFDLELIGIAATSPPFVSLTSPTNAANLPSGSMLLAAEAWDDDGAITLVEFFQGTTKVGEDATHPYEAVWTGTAPGTYGLTAVATDASGLKATSAVANVTVFLNPPPTVALTSPVNNQSFVVPGNVSLAATAGDSNGVAWVRFYAGTTLLGEDATAPYQWVWTNVVAGSYALTAVATDTLGASATSAVVNITVTGNYPPTVGLTSPTNGAVYYAPATVSWAAWAADYDGSIARVDFYSGNSKVGEAASSPYQFSWVGVGVGNYTLRAVAVDNGGLSATSGPVSITVSEPSSLFGGLDFNGTGSYVTFGNSGRATNLGLARFTLETWFYWRGGGQVGSSGSGGVNAIPLVCKGRGESEGATYNCNYFFGIQPNGVLAADFEEGPGGASMGLNHPVVGTTSVTPNQWNHAAVTYDGTNWALYLNGSLEASAFVGQPAAWDSIQHASLGSALTSSGQPQGYFQGTLDEARIWNYALSGAQIASNRFLQIPSAPGLVARWALDETSGTVAYDSAGREIHGTLVNGPVWAPGYPFALPPSVTLTNPVAGATLYNTNIIIVGAAASDADGTITNVAFYAEGTLLGQDPTRPYEVLWNQPAPGYYALRAVAWDNSGLVRTSAVVNVTVQNAIVQLASPANGAQYIAPDGVPISATVSTAGGAVSMVEFYTGATRLAQDTTAPYGMLWASTVGTHVLTAVATVSGGIRHTSAPVTITVVANQAPTVALTSPTNQAVFYYPTNLSLTATASDPDGSVSRVEFYAGSNRLGEDTTAPYGLTWTVPAVGDYALRAVATDNRGLSTTSAVANISVTVNTAPTVALVSPSNGASYPAPADILLTATASDLDGVSRVEFYAGSNKLGEATRSPYTFAWSGVGVGHYQLRAVATDTVGLAATSAVVAVTVTNNAAPVVALTAPADGSQFQGPTNLTLSATASDPDNNGIAVVEFYANGAKLGEDTTAPFSMVWNNVPGGGHTLQAIAVDGAGMSATSAPVLISVAMPEASSNVLVAANATWRYLDTGTNLGTNWVSPAFNDSAWSFGPAPLGYSAAGVVTTVGFGPDSNNKYITTYFRHSWVETNASRYVDLPLRVRRDDGVIVYLNGVEVFRNNIPEGPVDYLTLAAGNGDNGVNWQPGQAPAGLLVNGTNVLAVEIHQVLPTSSDILMALELSGVFYNWPPQVALTSPANGSSHVGPTNLLLQASASDSDGTVAKVEFFQGGTLLGEDTTPPYTQNWSVTYGGTYPFQVVATDNLGARSTSAVVNVNILANYRPVVSITDPFPGAFFTVPAEVTINVAASDPDGTVTNVTFLANGAVLGSDTASPFSLTWSNDTEQTVVLTAVAMDNQGAMGTSAPVTIYLTQMVEPGTAIAAGSIWKYLDDGSDQGTAWRLLGYDDSAWPSGPAELGFGDAGAGKPEATVIQQFGTNGQPSITFYFRHKFMVSNPSAFRSLTLRLKRDDGAVVYLNGVEIARDNMPGGEITSATLANGSTPDDGDNFWPFPVAPALLVAGTNVVAVEVHQNSTGSSDVSFDLELSGVTTNAYPTVTLVNPPDAAVFGFPGAILLEASATDVDGSIANVHFYSSGTNLLASVSAPPYSFTWQNVPLGTYALSAVAVDNEGARRTSSVATVFVTVSSAPTVASFAPASGVVTQLSQITVDFSEPVSGVDAGDLLINGVPASGVTGSNATYTFTFDQPAAGLVLVSWKPGHGIVDRELPPKPFSGTGDGETTRYTLVDVAAPAIARLIPAAGSAVSALSRLEITFSEAVGGVQADDLLVNGVPATRVSGSLAGPYVFEFVPPASGIVQFSWAPGHGIHDLASAPNAFGGGSWSCLLNPALAERGVLINEIMYHPASESVLEEYIELYNTNTVAMNLTGWSLRGGVDFDFPAVSIPAGGYLVIAANETAFRARYPGATNVVGNWAGRLSNRSDQIRLRNALGAVVCEVTYATEGDWALRQRGPLDNGSYGWEWFAAHDGNVINTATGANEGRRSLELRNPAMPMDNGQNWAASGPTNGTPGRANSALTNNVAPLIYDVAHYPPVPRSTNTVTITARVVDELGAPPTVQLFYRHHTDMNPGAFVSTNLFDNGTAGDALAGDGIYTATLPAWPAMTVVEFYVSATDATGLERTWPAPARQLNGSFAQTANALYQVDDENYAGDKPFYRLIFTGTETNEFARLNSNSDAEMNATFITTDGTGTKVRYTCGARIRGAGSRGALPKNFRVNIPTDQPWNGLTEVNLNNRYVQAQVIGSALSLQAGLPCAYAQAIQFRLNGGQPSGYAPTTSFGCYAVLEPIGGEWAARHFPDDPNGNVYRGSRYPWTANLDYRGTDPNTYMNEGYSKTSNQSDNDWTDLFDLTYVLSTNTPDSIYVSEVRRRVNVEMFMRYFAFCNAVDYRETSICRGVGDDYAMYRGIKDPRFLLIPHDYDTILNLGDTAGSTTRPIWEALLNPASTDPAQRANFLNRFMRHPEFAPIYYAQLKHVIDTALEPALFNPVVDGLLGGWAASEATRAKNFNTARVAYLKSQIPLAISIAHNLGTSGGYLFSSSPNVVLWGRANAIETRAVRVAGQPALWSAFDAAWTNTVALQPGINRVTVESLNQEGAAFESATVEIWYDDGSTQSVSGTLATSSTWAPATGPYLVSSSLTIPSGVTLTILPGTTVYFASGAGLTVQNGGRLLAEGTAIAPIRFTRTPGTSVRWGGIRINGAAGSPETRITHAYIEFNGNTAIHSSGGTVWLERLVFGSTDVQYLSLDNSSFVVADCHFPATTASFEPVHGSGGIKSGGRGIFLRNYFGAHTGYNDTIDFSGGQRPGPVVQFINNVFTGTGDDNLDLDSTDAWVEGNIFLHVHKNGSPDTSSAVSGGNDDGNTSEVTVINNIFYDCDHVALAKQGNFFTLIHNTIVRQTHVGGLDTTGALVCLQDNGMTEGAGMYLEGNVCYDIGALTRDVVNAVVTFTNNIMPLVWNGPGGNNSTSDPLLVYVPQVAETAFTNWAQAQILRQWFALRTGSPAVGSGVNGQNLGGLAPLGVSVAGEPLGVTSLSNVTLTVGVNRTGSGISGAAAAWPNGSGYTHYRWRLDGGAWSAETPLNTPIALTNLTAGVHQVEVVGRRDAGLYQDDPAYGVDAVITASRTWTVLPGAPDIRLNEVLASNQNGVPAAGRYPDIIELYNAGGAAVDLSGYGLTDNAGEPFKYTLPPGTVVGAGKYLVIYADNNPVPGALHTGWSLRQEGDDVALFAPDGRLVDTLRFGPQIPNLSIGRLADGQWGLTQPTFGGANRAVPMGSPYALRLNEWMASAVAPINEDFVEIYNSDANPVALGGLFLTEAADSQQGLHQVAALSFLQGGGYFVFTADGNTDAGPDHLGFKLAAEQGMIGLYNSDLTLIDLIAYGAQTNNVSQGRVPNGGTNVVFFLTATPGAANLAPPPALGTQILLSEVLAKNVNGLTNVDGSTPEWIELHNPTASAISLAGMRLTDNAADPAKYVFPAGVSIPAGGYRVMFCDGGLPASTNNTGFGIRANGGAVWLFDASGNFLDSISYGVQAKDFSIGRFPVLGSNWVLCLPTPGTVNNPVPRMGDARQLKVNEWMAAPVSGDDWFEIFNPDPDPVALGGLWLSDVSGTPAGRMKFRIAPLSFIGTGLYGFEKFVADNSPALGPEHVNFRLDGGSGEDLCISAPDGTIINALHFGPQQSGVSEGRLPDGASLIVRFPSTPTPADANYLPLTNVVIHEVLSASPTGGPLEDAIELRNLSTAPVDITGWYLSDALRTPKKFRITNNIVLPAGGFTVFYEYQFNGNPDDQNSFALNGDSGDQLYLSQADPNGNLTGYRAVVDFGAAEPAVSFGRYVNSVGQAHFVAMSARTFGMDNPSAVEDFRLGTGRTNAYPKVGPVVFSEIMYHPTDFSGGVDNLRDEFVELLNLSSNAVPLFDPAYPTNTWRVRGGVDFDLPAGVTLQPGERIVLVSFDPVLDTNSLAGFRAAYPVSPSARLFGPFAGKLDNGGEELELRKPLAPVPDGPSGAMRVPYTVVERVNYDDVTPWDALADGQGASLHRVNGPAYGNDPVNWIAAAPTPGPEASGGDADNDGLPDDWELLYGLNPFNPADAAQDLDGDGLTNLQEYLAGTAPNNPASTLAVVVVSSTMTSDQRVVLEFQGVAGRDYSVLYSSGLGSAWQPLMNLNPLPASGPVLVTNVLPVGTGLRFYRVVTPRLP